jgi:hypothetical protein
LDLRERERERERERDFSRERAWHPGVTNIGEEKI